MQEQHCNKVPPLAYRGKIGLALRNGMNTPVENPLHNVFDWNYYGS